MLSKSRNSWQRYTRKTNLKVFSGHGVDLLKSKNTDVAKYINSLTCNSMLRVITLPIFPKISIKIIDAPSLAH